MNLTNRQKQEYIRIGGIRCPYCGSGQINTTLRHKGEEIHQECLCLCEKSWTDLYTLTGIKEKKDGTSLEMVS
jgi:hypothetical protein